MTASTGIPKKIEDLLATHRRGFLKSAGLLAVRFAAGAGPLATDANAQAPGPYPDPDFHQLDSWIVIHDDNTATFYVGKTDLGLQGPRFGCGLGQCGACTVIINGAAVRSCILPVSAVKGEVTTLEGLSSNGRLHPLQQAWIDEQAPQCGFCQNGQIMTAKAMLDKIPHPSDAQIRETMNNTLCRCMSYYRVQAAIKRAAKVIAEARPDSGKEVAA